MDAFQRAVYMDVCFRVFDSIILDQYDTFWKSFRKIVLQFDRKWMDFHSLKGNEMPVYLDIVGKSIQKVEYVGETQTDIADDSTTMRNRTLQTGAIRETDKKVRGLTIRFGNLLVQ